MNPLTKTIKQIASLAGYDTAFTDRRAAQAKLNALYPVAVQEDFRIISKLRGFLAIDAYDLFLKLAPLAPQAPAFEIGVFGGRSLIALANAVKRKTVGVDPFFEDFQNEYAADDEAAYLAKKAGGTTKEQRITAIMTAASELDAKNGTTLKEHIEINAMTQADFLAQPVAEKFGLIHIDGEHTYGAVYEAVDRFDDLLVQGALVIIDDFINYSHPGICEATHCHRSYRQTLFPIFYGFNKAIFVFRPATPDNIATITTDLEKKYNTGLHQVNRLHDGSITVRVK